MTPIENILICMMAPLLVAGLLSGKKYRRIFLFSVMGMVVCLLSAYVNTFFARLYQADALSATVEIAPVCEETMKLLPLLFYLFVFQPDQENAKAAIISISAGFATLENAFYLTRNGGTELFLLFVRGFSTGAMHILCGAIVGYGLIYFWNRPQLMSVGTVGLLCTAITFHAIYNLLVCVSPLTAPAGYLFPVVAALIFSILDIKIRHYLSESKKDTEV